MKLDYIKIDDVNGEITVTLEEKDYADKVKKQLKQIAKTHQEPGFRPGKVPAGLIEKKYGDAVKYDIINKEVGNALFDYIKENNLHVLGNPMPIEDENFDVKAADFTLKFKVGIAPEFDTHMNKDLTIPYYKIQATDEMVENQDKMFSTRFGKQESGEEVDATALVKGVITELDENGEPKAEGIVMAEGIVSPQHFKSEEQRANFIGKKVGETVKFNPAATCDGSVTEIASMLGIDKEAAENVKGDFNMEIKDVIVLKPAEHNQEYFDMLFGKDEVHNEEEYQAALKEMIELSLDNDSNFRFSIDAHKAIMNAIGSLNLPADVIKAFLMSQNENLNPENIDAEYERMIPELEWELEKDAISAQLGVKVEEEDLMNTAAMMAQHQFAQYGMTNVPEEALNNYAAQILKDEKARQQVYAKTFDDKFYSAVREAVNAEEKSVSVEEFNNLFKAEMAEMEGAE